MMLDKIVYNTVLSQAFSPCGNYLVAGNIYGQLAVFDLDRILNPMVELLSTDFNKPKYLHQLESKHAINSLVSTDKFLIIGTIGELYGYDFKSILSAKLGKPSWVIRIPSKLSAEDVDINSFHLTEDGSKLFVGCGDNHIYSFNLEDGSLVTTFKGHDDYVHCVHGKEQQLVSASEDGTVKLWDSRSNKAQNTITPHKNDKVARPDVGKWIGAAAVGSDWIVCGGGPRLSLWHLRSLDAVSVFDIQDHGIHVATFHDDCVIAAGAAKHLYQLNYSGESKVEIPVSSSTIYSLALRTSPTRVLALAGSSTNIDFCTTFHYKDQVLQFR